MVKRVLLCGCGNIGFRHLQALSAMNEEAHITIIEPLNAAHNRIEDFISLQERHSFELLAKLPSSPSQFDLVIIATNAPVRKAVFDAILDTHEARCIIFEKVLFQTVAELDQVEHRLDAEKIPAFVNCGRRGFESYQKLAHEFSGESPTDVQVTGSNFGLASNAVHFLDLIEFLNGHPIVTVDLTELRPGSITSKRSDFVEVFGTLRATLQNGAKLQVTCDDRAEMQIKVELKHGNAAITIDELAGKQKRDGVEEPFEVKFVSGMPYLYEDALAFGDPKLTPYTQSARQHRLYIKAMLAHLGKPTTDTAHCPIS